MDDLDRVFQRLVQNIRSRSPEQLTLPFTVAELYEQMIPYRHNRRELGIETNQDYEVAVMRLLSGERGYIVGDEAMQESLKQALDAAEPDTGSFREYGSTQISIAPEALEKSPDRSTPAVQRGAAPRQDDTAQRGGAEKPVVAAIGGGGGGVAGVAAAPPPQESTADTSFGAVGTLAPPEGCRYCSGTLPEGRQVRFCPHCGQNLSLSQCPACGTEMEQGWKFCIGCGRPNS